MTATEQKQLVNRVVLNNGIVLLLMENNATDVVAGRIFLKNAGSRWDSRDKAGLSHLLAAVITKGTEQSTAIEIAEQVESMGASLGADAATDYLMLAFKSISADFAQILKIVGEILRTPSFPEAEVELEKRIARQNLRSQQEQPFNVAFEQLRASMYREHPYSLSVLGTEETIVQLSRPDLQQYHQTYFRPARLIVSLSGRLGLEEAVNLVEQVFGNWQAANAPIADLKVSALQSQPCITITERETQQAIVMLGYLSAAVGSQDYPILKLLSSYLGNGLSSRLFVELREKRGLAYDVSAFYPTRLEPSQFIVYMGTAPVNTAIALEGLRSEVERLCTNLLTPEELQAAKNKLLGQYALGKQTNAEIAQVYGWYETLGLGIDYDTQFQESVASVTLETAKETACRYLQQPYVSLVGPKEYTGN